MRRREFILGGAATAWSVNARAQQEERVRRIGVLLPAAADDAEVQIWLAAFLQALAQLGWTIGRNMRVDFHWATPDATKIRQHATELAAKAPDVILTGGTSTTAPMVQATRAVPIVFATVVDPVGAGLIDSLARPGGNATGFLLYEYSLGGKWLEVLQQNAPTNAGGCPEGRQYGFGNWAVCSDPVGGAVAQDRRSTGQHARGCRSG